MKITKKFVQFYESCDDEGRYFYWHDVDMSYEEAKKFLKKEGSGWFPSVREVEKMFDDETFMVTIKPLRIYSRNWVTGRYEEEKNYEIRN